MNKKYIKLISILILYSQITSCGSNKNHVKIEQGNNKNECDCVDKINNSNYYRIKKSDTLYKIGLKYNLSVNTLKKINNINDENKIQTGDLIKISINKVNKTKIIKNNPLTKHSQLTTNNINNKISGVKFIWPIKGNIVNNFNGKTNKGIDISSKQGQIVNSAADGVVLHADYIKGFGKSIIISHDPKNEILTVYGNLSNILISAGKKVKANQNIAKVGGNDKNTKLHFEIRNKNIALNPLNYLPK